MMKFVLLALKLQASINADAGTLPFQEKRGKSIAWPWIGLLGEQLARDTRGNIDTRQVKEAGDSMRKRRR
jgi:hypothetical protein